jgi:transcriptional regulator with PAS, ATPase and Fis domain
MIGDNDLPPELKRGYSISPESMALKDIEKEHIKKVLNINEGDKTKTAKELEIGIATLYRKINEYKL